MQIAGLDLGSIQFIFSNIAYTAAIALGAILVRLIAALFIRRLSKRLNDQNDFKFRYSEQRAKTIASVLKNAFNIMIYGCAVVMIISKWGVDIAPLLASVGIVGVAIGFGAQSLVKDIVTGFFIIFENVYNVGDYIEISPNKGIVKAITLRKTVLQGDDGTEYIIPNSIVGTVVKHKK